MQADASAQFNSGTQAAAVATVDGTRGADTLNTVGHHPEADPADSAKAWEKRARELAKKGDHAAAATCYEEAAKNWKKAGEFKKGDAALEKAEEQKKLAVTDGAK
jgi:hypothetical protein